MAQSSAVHGIGLALALIAGQAQAEDAPMPPVAGEERPHFALAAGSGVAFGGTAGLHAELIYQHFAAFFGVGADLTLGELPCYALGARWFLGDRSGFFVSGAAAWISVTQSGESSTNEFANQADLFLSAGIGYRALHRSGLFFDLGIGAAWLRQRKSGFSDASFGEPEFCGTTTNTYSCQKVEWRPDINVAVGFDF
jgi:hypothetical protein